jgi:hypothetical protein
MARISLVVVAFARDTDGFGRVRRMLDPEAA